MEGDDETSAVEAALGLSPQIFINEVINMIDDIGFQAFQYCLQEGASVAFGDAKATSKAEELKRGVTVIWNLVTDVLNKRMSNWETYCLLQCLTVPEGFVAPEDDNSSATVLHKDGSSDSELDAELDFLRKKLADANMEYEELQREIISLERQATYKSNLNSSIAEVMKPYEDKSVQENIQAFVNALPELHEKMKVMNRKKAEARVGQNVWNAKCLRDLRRIAPGSSSTPSTEDIQEVNAVVKGLRKE
ncbi:protein MIS12 homolog isoform X1 [Hordeum vulgare subsp. vulgare]|uniref:Protein MIS12 homolog n=1 Tax=Hordeum vulgare subsp. vulgare TaxID=112509 RepID=A0A8I6YUR7_HORVV|nr:protein MIS12 homolog isoform X1 [Hordeum vulgare subsp. vulgare]